MTWAAANPTDLVLPIVLVVGAIVALRLIRRRPPGSDLRSQPAAPARPGSTGDPEVSKLYVELSEFAREMEGRMDTKIAYLRRLITEAERVLGELHHAVEAAEAVRRGEAPPPAPAPTLPAGGQGPEAAPEHPAPLPGEQPRQEGVHDRVLSLFSEGKPKEAIAEEVGIPRGEVELVLSLHRARQKRPAGKN